jgi:hypothetical protein
LIGAAREHGIPVDEKLGSDLPKRLAAIKQPLREQLMERVSQGVSPIENSMFLLALASLGYPADTLTDALCHDLAGLQRVDGSWTALNQRPPIVYSPFSATAYVLRALQLYGSPGRRPEIERRIARAREWLVAATPAHTEDRAMQLLGLHWSGADGALIHERAKSLVQLQHRDGGWSQRSGLPTDAYATGQALYALHLAGRMAAIDPVLRHGMEYLLGTQHEDGSWFVRSRSVKFQPYFESGFPYGHDQWISAAGTNWAALALTLAAEQPSAQSQ